MIIAFRHEYMATATGKAHCILCGKEKSAVRCEGCLQTFCYNHLTDHRHELSKQLDSIDVNRELFRQALSEQTTDPQKHSLMKQIDKWEENAIQTIQQTAQVCRRTLLQYTAKHINQIEVNLAELADQLKEIREENNFNEIDLNQFKQKLLLLTEEFKKPTNISIQDDSASLVNKISVVTSEGIY